MQRNPDHVLEIEESSSPLTDAEFAVEFEGKYYSIRKFPISEGMVPSWNQEAFAVLANLYQMTVTDVSNVKTPIISIPKSTAMLRTMLHSGWWVGVMLGLLLAGWLSLRSADAMIGKPAPDITNATWLNSAPLRLADLRGKVVMVEFWTFGCYNCRNVEPYVKQWHERYADQGFVVIGVHSPEFSHEREVENVKRYIKEHDIRFPVPIDNDFSTWNRYGNRYWPAMYLVDKRGIIRYVKIGEGGYGEIERQIQALLAEG